MAKARSIPDSVRKAFWKMPCVICGCEELIEVDHIVPVSKGGGSEITNLQPLCFQCNKRKRNTLTNEQLKALFEADRERHIRYHQYINDTNQWRGRNFWDSPTFEAWQISRGYACAVE